MQVDPIRPTLKLPATKSLKLKDGKLRSGFAFNFNLRRYNKLLGHIHLLETRAQALQAKQFCTSGSAVKFLRDTGFLQIPGRALTLFTSRGFRV